MGIVDDFDARVSRSTSSPVRTGFEIRAEGVEPIAFDVNAQPNRTATYRAGMRPLRP